MWLSFSTTAMRNIGLFFGSFNPIHMGHLVIASSMLAHTDMDEVWFVVSPQNPLKERRTLLPDRQRLDMVRRAIEDEPRMRACDAEFDLPKPSYTVLTLAHLGEKYRDKKFSLIMGSDNLDTFDRWRNYDYILDHYDIFVYPRPDHDGGRFANHPHVHMVNTPMMDISSTYIREMLRQKKDIRFLVPDLVYQYIQSMHFYEK